MGTLPESSRRRIWECYELCWLVPTIRAAVRSPPAGPSSPDRPMARGEDSTLSRSSPRFRESKCHPVNAARARLNSTPHSLPDCRREVLLRGEAARITRRW